jgi:hypothetical protein
MNEFEMSIGHFQGFDFLWWLYLNHGIENKHGVFFVYSCSHFCYGKEYRWETPKPALPLVPCFGFLPYSKELSCFLPVSYLDTLHVFEVVFFVAIVTAPWSLLCEY